MMKWAGLDAGAMCGLCGTDPNRYTLGYAHALDPSSGSLMACDAERLELPNDHFARQRLYVHGRNPEVSIINLDNGAHHLFHQ